MILIDDNIYGFDLQEALQDISPERREKALLFKHELGKRTCVLAYQLLKHALREEYGIIENPVLGYEEHGKPFLVDHPDIFFNLSHCSKAVACVVSNKPVGIDIETICRMKDSIMRYTMNDDECREIMNDEAPEVAFTRLWTMKEALLKLSGEGLHNDMKQVLVGSQHIFTTTECIQKGYVYTLCE